MTAPVPSCVLRIPVFGILDITKHVMLSCSKISGSYTKILPFSAPSYDFLQDFTASIVVNDRRPEGFLLRGRSLAGLARCDSSGGKEAYSGTNNSTTDLFV